MRRHRQSFVRTQRCNGLWNAFAAVDGPSIGNLASSGTDARRPRLTRIVGFFLLAAVAITLPIITGRWLWSLPEPSPLEPGVQPRPHADWPVVVGAANEQEPLPSRLPFG
jgi:hypothetical protein